MQVQILREAETELCEAVIEYEKIEPGLGARFKDEIQRHVQVIQAHPTLPRLRNKNYRRVNLRIFPFYIAYHIRNDMIYVIAIAHGKRKPYYWKERV